MVKLLFQTPEVYKTDVAEQLRPKTRGFKFACRDRHGETSATHPSITFNEKVRRIHVHLDDRKTGEVYWDADFRVGLPMVGGYTLSSRALPIGGLKPVFERPCVDHDDDEAHLFDLSVKTSDRYYDDPADTPYGDAEGFLNLRGPKTHIGFELRRLPVINADGQEILGQWRRGGRFSKGPVHQDSRERILNGEEDIFYDPKTGDTGRLYYDWLIRPSARWKNVLGYLDKLAPPLLDPEARRAEFFGPDRWGTNSVESRLRRAKRA